MAQGTSISGWQLRPTALADQSEAFDVVGHNAVGDVISINCVERAKAEVLFRILNGMGVVSVIVGVAILARVGRDRTRAGLTLLALEWGGSQIGLVGAALLALNLPVSRYGWIAFLVANFAFIGFAKAIRAYGLLLQQAGFMLTSLLGIYRTFWPHL